MMRQAPAPRAGLFDAARITFIAGLILFVVTIVVGSKGPLGWIRKLDDAVYTIEQSVVALALMTITVVVFVDVIARRITLMIPVGLEKCVPLSIRQMAMQINGAGKQGKGPTLWPVQGEIVTELEAVRLLSGALAMPMAAGGINGGEGGLWISVSGTEGQLDKAEEVFNDIIGEPPFVE